MRTAHIHFSSCKIVIRLRKTPKDHIDIHVVNIIDLKSILVQNNLDVRYDYISNIEVLSSDEILFEKS